MSMSIRRSFTLAIGICFGTAAVLPAPEAQARGGGTAAAIIGGAILGAAIMHGVGHARSRQYRAVRVVRPRAVAVRPPRDEARQSIIVVQTVLTALECDPGKITGKMNNQTRDAIKCFQRKKGDDVTGKLTDDQQAFLIKVYNDAQQAKTAPARRDNIDQLFIALGVNAGNGTSAPSTGGDPNAPIPAVVTSQVNFRAVCRDDAMTTAMRESTSLSGPAKLLPDQFCLARSHVLADASTIFKKMATDQPTLKAEDVRAGCASFTESKRDMVAALTSDEPAVLAKRLAKDIAGTQEERDGAVETSKVCLGFGYADDKPDVVIASALFLVGLGQGGYGELIAGGFSLGLGVPKDNARAISWLEFTATEIDGGANSIVNSEAVSRAKILRLMAQELKTGPVVATQTPVKPNPVGPQFGVRPSPTPTPQPIPPAQSSDPKSEPAGLVIPAKPITEPRKMGRADLFDNLRENVVFIFAGDSMGTGFFISPTHIVTNTHVVQSIDKVLIVGKSLRVKPGKPPMIAAAVKYRGMINNVGIDAAVLEVIDYSHPSFLTFAANVREGEEITIAGYPGKALEFDRGFNQFVDLIKQQRAPTASQIPSVRFDTGTVQSVFTENRTGLENIQEGVNTTGGNSGSPIANACGQVVAIHYQGSRTQLEQGSIDTSKFNFGITMRELSKFLKDAGIVYQTAPEFCQPAG